MTQFGGNHFQFVADSGANYKADFYVNVANTNQSTDSLTASIGDDEGNSYFWTRLPSTRHYTIPFTATGGIMDLKPLYTAATANVPNHYFYFDSLKITIVGSTADTIVAYTADIRGVSDVSPFGAPLKDRTWNAGSDPYAFNGKRKDDEIYGAGRMYDYGFREQDGDLGRFWSIDPIARKYPELTPYQFASNRPIDGLDLDGLEYATFNIYVNKNQVVTKIHPTTDYELINKGTQGAGIMYNIIDANTGKTISSNMQTNFHGIYQGPFNPKLPSVGGNIFDVHDDYSLQPIDEVDKIAFQHDKDFDEKDISGISGVFSHRSTDANLKYIKSALKTIDKFNKGQNDDVTHKPVTNETKEAAEIGVKGFRFAENIKYKTPLLQSPTKQAAPSDASKVNKPKPKSVPSY